MTYAMTNDYQPESNVDLPAGTEDYYEAAKSKPIPVYVMGSERERVAKYRSTLTVTTIGAADILPVQRILSQTAKRHRAVISSRPLLTGEASAEYVLIGSEEQVMNGQGYRLWNGEVRVIESSSALFIGPGTNPPTHNIAVSVIDERFE